MLKITPTLTPRISRSAGGIALLLALAGAAHANPTYNWVGPNNGHWNTAAANWSGAGTQWVNGSTSNAAFPAGPALAVTLDAPITLESLTAGAMTLTLQGSNSTPITIAGSDSSTSRIDIASGGRINLNMPVSGTMGLHKTGGGTLWLAASCNYTGLAWVEQGTMELSAGALPAFQDITIETPATVLCFGAGTQQIREFRGTGTLRASPFSSTDLVVRGHAVNAYSGVSIRNDSGNTGSFRVTKVGADTTQTLAGGLSDYSLGTFINEGTLIANVNAAFGTGAITVASGATWGCNGATHSNNSTIAGSGAAGRSGAIDNIQNFSVLTGQITASGSATIGTTYIGGLTLANPPQFGSFTPTFNPGYATTITLPTVNTTAAEVVKNGGGTLELTGPSGFGNTLTINLGIVKFGHAQAIQGVAVNMLPGGVSVLRMNGVSGIIRSLSGGDANTYVDNASNASPATLTLGVPAGTWYFAGNIGDGDAPSASLGLTKLGVGTQVLSTAMTHTGATTVSAGTLTVNSGITVSPVTINGGTLDGVGSLGGTVTMSSGVLAGSRTISGLLTMSGGTVRPGGASQGTFTLQNGLSVSGGVFELQAPAPLGSADQVVVNSGDIALGSGAAQLALSYLGSPAIGPNDLVPIILNNGTGTTTGYFANFSEGSEVLGLAGFAGHPHWFIYYHADTGTSSLTGGNDVVISPKAPPTLRNGSFETGPGALGQLPVGSNAMDSWRVTRGNIDWVGAGTWMAADGARSLDLQGLSSSGGVVQFVGLQSGARYRLKFAIAGNPEGSPTVKNMRTRINGTELNFSFDTAGKSLANVGWEERSLVFSGSAGNTEIEFYSADPAGHYGAAIDNVRLAVEPCAADVAGLGSTAGADGQQTVDDLVFFLSRFFANDRNVCDIVQFGGAVGSDGQVNVDDLVAFLAAFFTACP